jgi:hypothetical protein
MTNPLPRNYLEMHQNHAFRHLPAYEPATFVEIEEPLIGSKIICLRERGKYVLETGPTLFRSMACTHAGSGGVVVYDGVPDNDGFFPERVIAELNFDPNHEPTEEEIRTARAAQWNYNGREVYYAHPACMGMWMLDGGCHYGLTIESRGTHENSAPVITVTWQKHKQKTVPPKPAS